MKNKETAALHEFIQTMSNRFHREAFDFLKSKEEAEEAVNSVFEKLWRKAGHYTKSRPPLPYVISVLRNHCRDVLRKKSRRINCVSLDTSKKSVRITERGTTDHILDEVLKDTVVNEVAKLHYVSGFTPRKISYIKKITIERVEGYLAQARELLIPYLEMQQT